MSFIKKIAWLSLLIPTFLLYQNCEDFSSHEALATSPSVDNPEFSGSYKFSCEDDSKTSPNKSLLLTKKQLSNALEDLFGTSILNKIEGPMSSLANSVNDSTSFERKSLISLNEVDALFSIASSVAVEVVQDRDLRERVFGGCSLESNPDANCIDKFVSDIAIKIFRRPLTSTEESFIKSLANSGGDYLTNLEGVLSYSLQSPSFLWRLELGEGKTHTENTTDLTPYEVATRIAFATTDSIPDEALLKAAKNGDLDKLPQIKSHTKRLLQTARGKVKVTEMLAWWAMADRTADIGNLPAELIGSVETEGLPQAISEELRQFVKYIIYDKNGSYRDLMTSKASFATHRGLASIYGHSPANLEQPQYFPDRRQGLLMRAGFLSHDNFRTSIIHRGVDFQQRFLCNPIPSPNVEIMGDRDADALTHEELLNYTNREAVAHQTKSPTCMGCHSLINPTGFLFENFDSLGRFREVEMIFDSQDEGRFIQDLPIHTSAVVPMSTDEKVPLRDAHSLIDYMVDSGDGAACFSRNIFRFLNEKLESKHDDCELQQAYLTLMKSDRSVLEAITDLIANEHITEKVH